MIVGSTQDKNIKLCKKFEAAERQRWHVFHLLVFSLLAHLFCLSALTKSLSRWHRLAQHPTENYKASRDAQ